MIPQMDPRVYYAYQQYLIYGRPPLSAITIRCEKCGSSDLVILKGARSTTPMVKDGVRMDKVRGDILFFCPYCLTIERLKIRSEVLKDITIKDVIEAAGEAEEDE